MELICFSDGRLRGLYAEAIDYSALGKLSITRASYVEPDTSGAWSADLSPVAGPTLGPFACRSEALHAEERWLTRHLLESRKSSA